MGHSGLGWKDKKNTASLLNFLFGSVRGSQQYGIVRPKETDRKGLKSSSALPEKAEKLAECWQEPLVRGSV